QVTYHIAVDAAAIAGNLNAAMKLFADMKEKGLEVTERRVEYIRAKLATGSAGGGGRGRGKGRGR
ncbi:unnamed protein product, partial [Choristocarpus tenellus]